MMAGDSDSYDGDATEAQGPMGSYGDINKLADARVANVDPRRATVRQRLQLQLAEMKKQQAQLEQALAALDKIPDVEVLLDLLRRVGI